MKWFLPAVAALVVGIVLGALQPRGELRALRAELDALRGTAGCTSDAAAGVRELLGANGASRPKLNLQRGGAPKRVTRVAAPDAPAGPDEEPEAPDAGAVAEAVTEGLANEAEAVGEALDARRAQARAALREQAALDDADMGSIDEATAAMNTKLAKLVDELVTETNEVGEVDRRMMLGFAAEALDVVIEADDRLQAALPEDVDVDDALLDPLSYLSSDALQALERLERLPGVE